MLLKKVLDEILRDQRIRLVWLRLTERGEYHIAVTTKDDSRSSSCREMNLLLREIIKDSPAIISDFQEEGVGRCRVGNLTLLDRNGPIIVTLYPNEGLAMIGGISYPLTLSS